MNRSQGHRSSRPWIRIAFAAVAWALFFLALFGCGTSQAPSPSPGDGTGGENAAPASTDPPPDPREENPGLVCAACHEEQHKFWKYGSHAEQGCANCHGVETDHVKAGVKPQMKGNAHCLSCHSLREEGDPDALDTAFVFERHLKFLEKKHVIQIDRKKVANRCLYCHDPHLGQ